MNNMDNRFPYFEIIQNDQAFIMTKMPVSFLANTVNFHFRSPYEEGSIDFVNSEKYVQKIEKATGMKFENSETGIQRRTDLKRIHDIANYIKSSSGIIFPTPIVLSLNVFLNDDYSEDYQINDKENELYFSNGIEFTIIDGQHRLAGLVRAFRETNHDIEMPVTLIINADLSVATQMFIDINGNQRKVNKSMIYDLYDNINAAKVHEIAEYVSAVKALNKKETSPLYGRVKLLGTGTGAISQAFLVEYIQKALKDILGSNVSAQNIYSMIFAYFASVKKGFASDWVIQERARENSQLVKTNGIGALLLAFPKIHQDLGSPVENRELYEKFFVDRSHFKWNNEKYVGTGKKVQQRMADDLLSFI